MTSGDRPPAHPNAAGVDRRIAEIRGRMDELDSELVRLLNERASCAKEIGRLKETVGLAVYQPEREIEVLKHVRSRNDGPLEADAITRLFERIIDEARRLERSTGSGTEEV
jgi:chorismate mutase